MALCPVGHESQTTDYCDVCGEAITGASVGSAGAGSGSGAGAGAGAGAAAGSFGVGAAGAAGSAPAAAVPNTSAGATGGTVCANCGSAVSGRFCEECGFDTALPAPAQPVGVVPPTAPSARGAPDPGASVGSGSGNTAAQSGAVAGGQGAGGWSVMIRADHAWYTRALSRNGPDAGSVTFPPYFAERRFRLQGPEMMIGKRDEAAGIHPTIDLRVQPEDVGISRSQAVLRQRADGGWEVVDIGSTNGTTVGEGVDPIAEFTPVALEPGDQFHIGAWTTVTLVRD